MSFSQKIEDLVAERNSLQKELNAMTAKRDGLVGFFDADVNCPCCGEPEACADGCTFAEDFPNESEKMQWIREAVKAAK